MMPQLLCDDQDLKRFLEGDLSPAEESTWLEHIESCRECQTRLEGLAASRDWWSQAKSFLTESDPTGPGLPGDGPMARQMPISAASGGALPVDDPEESTPEPVSLEFLGPTDDPESLGRIGIYEVTGVIGRGGSGIVFKAFDPTLDRNVAIKVLSPHLAASGAARKRFAREAQAAAAVVHEHVIPIFAVASHQNLPYIVMQYFPGRSLQQRLDRDGPLELKEILRIGLQTARGLAAAHAQGLIHRDVKPANILLGDGIERVSLSDFGLARALDDARLTRTGWLAGTPEYMSPEQAKGQALDARSDLFSLGSVLYALCTGRVPFHAETSYGTLRQVTDEEPTSIRQINPDIPEWLCRLIGQLMAKTPAERLGSASEVADLLETCLAHVQQPDSTALPAALQPKPQTAPSSHSGGKRTLVATLLGFLGFLLAGVFLWQSTNPPDIAGWWTGEDWGKVQLKHLGSGEYEGTYSDTFGKDPGQIQLKWSRIERRFNGTWREGEDRFGELSLRLVKEEIRGALTTDARSKINPGTPRLADLVWVKLSDQGPGIPGTLGKQSPQSSKVRLESFQGEWVPHRVIGEDGAELAREKFTPRVWTIKGTNLIVEGEEIQTFPLTVVETGPPVRIEFTAPVSLPSQARKPSLKTTEISSLWERRTTPEGERLIIVVGQDGKKPTQVKPTAGFVFYELRRLALSLKDGPPPAMPAAKDEVAENPILKNLPYLNQLFRNERRETSHPPKAVTPTDKAELFKYLQGNWVIEKQILLNAKGTKTEEKGGDVWNIEGTNLTTWARPDIRTPLEILSLEPQIRIDFVVSGALRESLGANPYGSFKIPTLWEIGGEKLKVVLAQRGVLPQKAEPTPDCIYFELARKPRSETTRLGFPARFQGKWKVSRMVGPDQKDGQRNLGETVTIEPGLLRIGDQIKKAELVDTGSLLKGNLVTTVISTLDGSKSEVRLVSLWELTQNKIRFVQGMEVPAKVEPGTGCMYFELERIEKENPVGPFPNWNRTPPTGPSVGEFPNKTPGAAGTNLVLYRKKPDGVDRFVQNLPRHPFGFDQPRKTEEVVVPGARFTVTWKWGNRLPLVPGPDAELLDVQILKSGDPVSRTLTKQVYLVGHSVTLHEDDNFKLVLEPTSGSLSATKKVSETPELIAMLEKIKTNDSVCWENQGVGLFREADLIFCCQKKGLLRCDEYRDQKWLRSQVLNFPQSKILSVDSDPSVPRGEGTLDATSLHLQNLFVQFADMASDRAILLGQETVEGKPCNLYRIQSDAPYQKTYQDRYLWVDQATHLPTAIRFAAKEAPAVFTYRQFLWSLPLGDDHFHLETTKEKRPAPPGKPKTEVGSPTSKTETKDPQSTPKAPDKKTSTKP